MPGPLPVPAAPGTVPAGGMMIPGHATAEATAEYFNSRAELGGWLEAGLHCSHVGFGGYRVDDRSPTQVEALKTALLSGCNLIDTSSNYTDGGSERAVGKAMGELIKVGVLDREQVVLVSKLGYVQGQALDLAQEREAAGKPFPEMVKYMEGCWHCIHPEFLAVQLRKSLERLDVECLDFCLLHNPEYFLMDAVQRGTPAQLPKLRADFYDRIRRAFGFFEEQVAAGKLLGYGVSSNTLGAPSDRADATSLSLFLEAARAAAQDKNGAPDKHHFQVAQLPMNLYETGPYLVKNTGPEHSQTALEFAAKNRIAVLVNRPLNAFTQQQMVRLSNNDAISARINPFLPEEWRKASLSQKALGILIHTPGVSCVLNGMRKPAYVHDSMGAVPLKRLPEDAVKKIYAAMQ